VKNGDQQRVLLTAPARQTYESTVCQNRKAKHLHHFMHANLGQVFHFHFAGKNRISVTTWMHHRSDQYKMFSRKSKRPRTL